jgi:hypothetical protein
MEGLTKLFLTSIFGALPARAQSGQFSVSWAYDPHAGCALNARAEDGTLLSGLTIGSRLLNELHSKLSAEATGSGKP